MNRHEIRVGPGAASLMLIAVVLSMSVLGLLSLMNARTDLQMARRSAQVSEQIAALDVQAEETFARIDAVFASCNDAQTHEEYIARAAQLLPEGVNLENDTVSWLQQGEDHRILECAAQLAPLGEMPRLKWKIHRHMPVLEGNYELD